MLSLVRRSLLVLAVVAAHKSFADNPARLQGVWKLLSYTVEYQATGRKEAVMGEKPIGYESLLRKDEQRSSSPLRVESHRQTTKAVPRC